VGTMSQPTWKTIADLRTLVEALEAERRTYADEVAELIADRNAAEVDAKVARQRVALLEAELARRDGAA
jgi:uncharacterized protein (UPF0335 family)